VISYFDSSALVKLARTEVESSALQAWLSSSQRPVASSLLAKTEVLRALRRLDPEVFAVGRQVVDGIELVGVTPEIAERAIAVAGPSLRSLNAIHLATALELGDDVSAFVAYDRRLVEAAADAGLPVVSP